MVPVDVLALKEALNGTVPDVVLAVNAATSGIVEGRIKANGVEWELSVPLLKVAVNVKLVLSVERDTVQSSDVAAVLVV